MSILRAMLFNHDTNCSIRETISEFFHNACTPVPTGRAGGGGTLATTFCTGKSCKEVQRITLVL